MKNKERKLTEKEQQRKEKFDILCEKMASEGYVKTNLTVGVVAANFIAIVIMAPFMALALFAFCFTVSEATVSFTIAESLALFPVAIALIVLHELIHGFTWGCFAKSRFRSIDFGVIWSALTPYCTCSEPLKRWQYILGGLMPTLILGFGLTAVSCFFHSLFWLIVSEFLILGGGGDFIIVLKILLHRSKGKDTLYYDHPYECGVVVFEK